MKNKAPKKSSRTASKKAMASKSKPSAKKITRAKGQFSVQGQVQLFDGSALADVLVRAVDKDMYGKENLLGEVRTDKKGAFTIYYTEEQFRRTDLEKGGADLIVRIVDAKGTVIASSRKINSAKSDETVNVVIGGTQASTTEHFIVYGIITQDGKPRVGVVVKAYDRDVRREEWLGETVTDAAGNYEIIYDHEYFAHAEQSNADVFIRIFDADSKLLGTSGIVFNASPLQEINYVVGDRNSRWEKLNAILFPLLKEQKLSDYKLAVLYRDLSPAELESPDIQFLANDTGIDQESIRKWALAYATTTEQSEIPAELFYGWFSMGLPEQLSHLWKTSFDKLISALKQAIADNIIPASTEALLEKLQAKIRQLQAETKNAPLLKDVALLSSSFNDNQDLLAAFTKLYLDKAGDWSVIKPLLKADTSFPGEILSSLFFTHGLMMWSGNNAVLMKTFQQDTTARSLWDIAVNFDKESLAGKIPESAIPASDTKDNFTTGLYNALYAMEPTGVVVNMINNPKIPLWNNETGNMISGVLSKVPEFNIKTTSVYEVIHNEAALQDVAKEKIEQVISSLKTLQRVTLVSPVPEAVPALINNNYLSTYSITALPVGQFMATMLGSSLPQETLQYIYAAAEKKKAFYEHVLITVKEAGEQTGIAMIDGNTTQGATGSNSINPKVEATLAKNNLSWELLFGDADFCECGECTSVYSAAAYYVDLLQYLRNNNLDPAKVKEDPSDISNTPLEQLLARRPDLGHLELTCKNTNTILPYVDLVNEVMEQYIAFKLRSENFLNYTGFNVDDETPGELLSTPQHTEQDRTYQILQTTLFPFDLPYHQPIDAARIFLNQLNTSRHEVIDTFRSNNTSVNFDLAADAEFLGLAEETYRIITKESFNGTADNHTTDEYYGVRNVANWLEKLSEVKDEFLPRTGIQYTELVDLLKTEYINPGFAVPEHLTMLKSLSQIFSEALDIYEDDMAGDNSGVLSANPDLATLLDVYDEDIRAQKLNDFFTSIAKCIVLDSPDNHCSLDQVKLLHGDNTALTDDDYSRLHRFIRLWRKLGFTMDKTDKAIITLGSGSITPELIHQLVALKKIVTRTGLDLTKVLCFWGNIGTAGENSLYKRLFLTHNLLAMDDVFENDLTGSETLSDHLPAVMAALNLSADDISLIKTYKSLPDQLPLTLANLSLLYRYRLGSKTLGLRMVAFIKLVEVVGDVFEDPDTTLRFLENVAKIEEVGFSIDQLSYVTNGSGGIDNALLPTKKEVIVLAKKIYDGQNTIETEHADLIADSLATTNAEKLESIRSQATSELVRSKAALLYEGDRVEKIISILEGTALYSTSAPVFNNIPVFTGTLGPKVKYIKTVAPAATGSLQVKGALTTTELTQLRDIIPNTDTNFVSWSQTIAAIERLQQELYADIFSGIFATNPAEETILKSENNATSAPEKRSAFLRVFLPYLRKKLTQTHVVTTLSEQTGLDKTTAQSLVDNILEIDGFSLYEHLTSSTELPAPTSPDLSWYGKLIPLSEDDFVLIVRCKANTSFQMWLDNVVVLEHTGTQATETIELRSTELKLLSGKVYQLSMEGIRLGNLYWKTKTSSVESIPTTALLPDFKKKVTRATVEKLERMAILIEALSLSADELNHIHTHRSDFNNINFGDLSFYHLLRIIDYCNLRDSLPKAAFNVVQFWERLNDTTTDLGEQIANLTKWKKETVDQLISSAHFNLTKADFKNEKNLLKLQQALAVASKVGIDIDRLFEWAIPTADFHSCKTIASSIQKSIRAQYNQTDWEHVVKPLNDQLRNNQKNALIAYLLQQPDLKDAGVTDADGLFEYFLIDVQMDTCMETSRIKQAISSVQLFIQRCFLGFEEASGGISPDALSRERWDWMQRYRVWEANRKVFLYPENWIESNLRDDQTSFFKELQSELLQKDINKQNVTDALKTYLYKVDEIADMEVIGLHIQGTKTGDTSWEVGSKLHVFSRTRNVPYSFYYRYLALDEMNWCPWEKVQVDIPCYDVEESSGKITGNGCYLIPMVWKGRLLIFFPQIVKKTRPNTNASGSVADASKKDQTSLAPIEYREIKMAYSEYKNGKWTQKQLSKSSLYDDRPQLTDIPGYNFYPEELSDSIRISIYGNAWIGYSVGRFNFDGSHLKSEDIKSPDRGYYYAYFHHYFGIFSYQTHPAAGSMLFDDGAKTLFHWIPNRATGLWENFPSHLLNSARLLSIVNSSPLSDLFEFNLSVPANQWADVFGQFSQVNYHELKRPYSIYNWELFFHTPIMIANALSKAQQFEEAMKWFHCVFNPIAEGEDDNRFWRFIPFREIDSKNTLEQIFTGLSANEPDAAINEWRNNPFKPHVVARSRPVAYMKWVVMKYIDNILEWGDYLFRQDTIESINQATQLYILASHILGRKPMLIPKRGEVKAQTYLSLLDKWDAFSNAISELEVAAVYTIHTEYTGMNVSGSATADIFGSASALYFCIPKNPKLIGYWDTVADRLFKIRHCQNIEGVFRKLPLFEPPIDPALLVKAAAQGLSISSVVNDLNTPMPNYRFYYLLQKAQELCGELKSLGGAILSAIEKKDNETISAIRARHEGTMNNLMMEIKKLQLEEAEKSLESLQQNRKGPEAKMRYYLQLLGEDAAKLPATDSDFSELANSIDQPVDESGLRLSKFEKEDMDKSSEARVLQLEVGQKELLASILHLLPTAAIDAKPMGIGIGVQFGGPMLGGAMQAWAKALQNEANGKSYVASIAAKKGGFQRAMQERVFQANAAGYEVKQIDKQITAQQIKISITNQEISNQKKLIENSNEVEEFLQTKYSGEELYTWMRGSLKTLYRQAYNLAYDLAKKAERTYCFERGISQANFIQSGYFDAGREGLLAGEQLYIGLKQLEAAYQEKRGYDFEITKHVSLRQLDPFALLQLKTRSSCEFSLPEVLFDMDYPGHFKRRIKSVSVSIPCIAGPYTGVNATLRLLNNKFRNSSMASNASSYPEKTDEQDERFITYNIPITAIATSSAQNDAGMFELSFKDERYLPFEGAGVISRWRLELPPVKQFDYSTISDVVLHVKYMASEGGDQLKNSAGASVISQLNRITQQLNETGLHIPISLKHDMPNEWNALKQNGSTEIKIDKSRLPYFAQVATPAITAMLISKSSVTINVKRTTDPQAIALSFSPLGDSGLQKAEINNITLGNAFTLSGNQTTLNALDELVLLVKFTI